MKSIRTKITLCLMLTVLTALLLVGAVSISLNYSNTIATVDKMMSESATLAAERVEQELTAYKNVAMDTGCIPQLTDESVSTDEKRSVIDERVAMHGFKRGNIVGADGISIFRPGVCKAGHAGQYLCVRASDQQGYRGTVDYGGGASL